MWWVHLIFIAIEILIGIGLYILFSVWNEYLEIKRTGYRFCEVTLDDKSHRAVWLTNMTVTDLPSTPPHTQISMFYTDGSGIQVSREHIVSVREIKKVSEIVRKL